MTPSEPDRPVPPLGVEAARAVRELAHEMRAEIRRHGRTAKEASIGIGRGPHYLSRIFQGRHSLKVKDAFAVFEFLGIDPHPFFERLYPEPRLIWASIRGPAPHRPAPALVEQSRLLLRRALRDANRTQTAVSLAFSGEEGLLSAALRGAMDLWFWHVFGVLFVLAVPPSYFFAELLRPASDGPGLRSLGPALGRAYR